MVWSHRNIHTPSVPKLPEDVSCMFRCFSFFFVSHTHFITLQFSLHSPYSMEKYLMWHPVTSQTCYNSSGTDGVFIILDVIDDQLDEVKLFSYINYKILLVKGRLHKGQLLFCWRLLFKQCPWNTCSQDVTRAKCMLYTNIETLRGKPVLFH